MSNCTKTTLDIILEVKDPQIISDWLRRIFGLQIFFYLFLHGRVPMVLYGVVGTTIQQLGYFGPFVSQLYMTFNNDTILVFRPHLGLVDPGVEMIVPSLSALFPCSSRELGSNSAPLFGSCREKEKPCQEAILQVSCVTGILSIPNFA